MITDARTEEARTDARTGVTLYAPPPFFEWRGHKNALRYWGTSVLVKTVGSTAEIVLFSKEQNH